MRALVVIVASVLIPFSGQLFAKPAGCPCSPCTCSPCSCGGGGGGGKKGDSGGKKGDKHHHHHGDDHGGVGVGVNIDIGRATQSKREPDPFAVSSGEPATPHTQEKHKPKTKEREGTTTNPFNDVKLTGREAKDESIPPSTFNISDDKEEPKDGAASGDKDKATGTLDNLKQASDAYLKARKKALEADPKFQAALKIWMDNSNARQGSAGDKAGQKAMGKITKLKHAFAQSDEGKKLYDDWVQAYDAAVKSGQKITDKNHVPSEDEIAQKKFDVDEAQDKVNAAKAEYDWWKNGDINKNTGVKNTQAEIDALKKKTHFSDEDAKADRDKVKQLEGDLENAKKQIAKDFASSQTGIDQAKKIQQAEQELGKAKEAFKPYEQLQEKPKAASNP